MEEEDLEITPEEEAKALRECVRLGYMKISRAGDRFGVFSALSKTAFSRFMAVLNRAPVRNSGLRRLLASESSETAEDPVLSLQLIREINGAPEDARRIVERVAAKRPDLLAKLVRHVRAKTFDRDVDKAITYFKTAFGRSHRPFAETELGTRHLKHQIKAVVWRKAGLPREDLEPSPPIPILPSIEVIRDRYCSQSLADSALLFVQQTRPDLMTRLLQYETAIPEKVRDGLGNIASYLNESATRGAVDIPVSHLGMLDLMFELRRRLTRAAESWPEWKVGGKPLTKDPDHSFPPLPDRKKTGREPTTHSEPDGLSQELADRLLRSTYEKRPDLWFELAEDMRLGLYLHSTEHRFAEYVLTMDPGQLPFPETHKAWRVLILEARRRLTDLCDMDEMAMYPRMG